MPNNIKRLRLEKGWTQERLAQEIKVTPSLVSKLENDSGDLLKRLPALAKALDVEPRQVLDVSLWGGIYLKGHIKMGEPRQSLFWDEKDWQPEDVPTPKLDKSIERFLIRDDDKDELLECTDDKAFTNVIVSGKRYIFETQRDDGVLEFFVARVQEGQDGRMWAHPDLPNQEAVSPFPLPNESCRIVARILRYIGDD